MAENYFGITDTGKLRDNNEDSFIAEPVLKNAFVAACVIDGVGGYEGGEVAAAIARESILSYFSIPSGEIITMMREAISLANKKIYEEKINSRNNRSMACVLTLALVDRSANKFYYAHVGDTRLYLLRDNSLVKVTKDHSFVGFLEDSGRLSEASAMAHPKRNEINKALGFDGQTTLQPDYIETGESPFLPGDTILLCSDGLTDMIASNEITSILSSGITLEEKGKKLVEAANLAGGKDNITVVLVQNSAKPVKQSATKPSKKNDSPKDQLKPAPPKDIPKENRPVKNNSNKGLVAFLSLLCLAFAGAFVWSYFFKKDPEAVPPVATVEAERNPQEKRLLDSLNGVNGNTLFLVDSLFGKAIFLTDALWIEKDTLHIKGSGNTVLVSDSSFTGAAFLISPNSKYILLDSLTLQDFNVGIVAGNPEAVHLKDVRFRNCSIQFGYRFPVGDTVLFNGSLSELRNFKKDSL